MKINYIIQNPHPDGVKISSTINIDTQEVIKELAVNKNNKNADEELLKIANSPDQYLGSQNN